MGLAVVASVYGIIGFSAGWSASGHRIDSTCMLFGILLSLAFFGFKGLAHVVDYEEDGMNDETTVAVALGTKCTRYMLAICQSVPLLILVLLGLISGPIALEPNWLLVVPLLLCAGAFSIMTTNAVDESLLCSLRVLSVPVTIAMSFSVV